MYHRRNRGRGRRFGPRFANYLGEDARASMAIPKVCLDEAGRGRYRGEVEGVQRSGVRLKGCLRLMMSCIHLWIYGLPNRYHVFFVPHVPSDSVSFTSQPTNILRWVSLSVPHNTRIHQLRLGTPQAVYQRAEACQCPEPPVAST